MYNLGYHTKKRTLDKLEISKKLNALKAN